MRPIRHVGVVVPAHDEQEHIGACLAALRAAQCHAGVPVRILVVLDACRDRTAAICRSSGIESIVLNLNNVGAVRRAGMSVLLAGQPDLDTLWLATTDADTSVPPHWLRQQVRLADHGADAVAGTVQLPLSTPGRLRHAFDQAYRRSVRSDGSHDHVHGANMGMRARAYVDVGGFSPFAAHEDQDLMARLGARHRIARPAGLQVLTSSRLEGRCATGFAATLGGL